MLYTSTLQFNKYFSPGSVSAHRWVFTLNPSQQIRLDTPRSGRGAAICTKGIIDTIKLFTGRGGALKYHKQILPVDKTSLSSNLADYAKRDLPLRVGSFY